MKTLHEEDIAGMSHTPSEAADTILAAGPGPAGSRLTEAVVVAVAESAGEAAVELDDPVDSFGAAVVRTCGGEVREERVPPSAQGAVKTGLRVARM